MYSKEHATFLKNIRKRNLLVHLTQLIFIIFFFII